MKLRAITLENVRRFTDPVAIAGIGDGLNVLCEPNESGKSTILDALHALFFLPHGSKAKEIKALQPHQTGAPEVRATIETGDGTFDISKRWLSRAHARVERDGTLIAQADKAEDFIAALLSGDGNGPAGLIWVRQGEAGLDAGDGKRQATALEARRDLLSSVTGEVEAMTGGRRMDKALARCRAELGAYVTGTGRPTNEWRAAQDDVARLTGERDTLAATSRALHDALDARRRHHRQLAELEDPEAEGARHARLEAAERTHDAAERHAQTLESAAATARTARHAAETAAREFDARRDVERDLAEATRSHHESRTAADHARAAQQAAAARATAAREARAGAEAADTEASALLERARRAEAARDGAGRRSELERRIALAERTREGLEAARAAAANGPDARAMQRIETLATDCAAARAARDMAAAHLVIRYDAEGGPRVRLDGKPLDDGARLIIDRARSLALDGIGTLSLDPGADGPGDTPVAKAETALARALADLGAPDIGSVRDMAERTRQAERDAGEARAAFEAVAPDGIDALRAALQRIPSPLEDDETQLPSASDAEASSLRAREALRTARSAAETANAARAAADADAARADAAAQAVHDRLDRARATAERLGPWDVTAAQAAMDAAMAEAEKREDALRQATETAPDLAATGAALARARDVVTECADEISRLRLEIATLDERIRRDSGDAVEERLAETAQRLETAEATEARIGREVATLRRLEDALETARGAARDRYFAPIAAELRPLLHLLWPGATLDWSQDTLLPNALIRDGLSEPIEILSGGTQEQIALLVRLAFARMLAADGRHAPVILDDAFVYSDDDRIEHLFDALHRQAASGQIIVLSCRQRTFRDLGGRTLRLSPAPTAAS